jgi:hypothetical protein
MTSTGQFARTGALDVGHGGGLRYHAVYAHREAQHAAHSSIECRGFLRSHFWAIFLILFQSFNFAYLGSMLYALTAMILKLFLVFDSLWYGVSRPSLCLVWGVCQTNTSKSLGYLWQILVIHMYIEREYSHNS